MPVLWKEWREQRWKLAFGTIMLCFFTATFLIARRASGGEIAVVIWILGGFILALYSAMGVFAPEQTNRTAGFLAARPVRPEITFLIKWGLGWLNVAVPMVASLLLALVISTQQQDMEMPRQGLKPLFTAGLGAATMLYTLTTCLAPRRAGEAMVGLAGLLVVVGSLIYMYPFTLPALDTRSEWWIVRTLFFVSPFSWVLLIDRVPTSHPAQLATIQAVVLAATLWIGVKKWTK